MEQPDGGDETRATPLKDGFSTWVQFVNRGKMSLTLDLKNPASKPVMKKLVEWADLVPSRSKRKPGLL